MSDNPSKDRVVHVVLERQAARYGDRPLLYFKDQEFSYKGFNDMANRVACGLQNNGITQGDRVSILMPNCPEYLFLWFGLSKLGAIEVPLNTAQKGDLLTYLLNQSESRMLVMETQFAKNVAPILGDCPGIEKVVVVDIANEEVPELSKPVLKWEEIIDNNGSYEPCEVSWSDPTAIMYTSGTTGPSKGVLLPHNFAIHSGELAIDACGYDENDCIYCVLPLFHGNAQHLSFMPALMSGARLALSERFSAKNFWDEIKRYGCTEVNYVGGIIPILYKADPSPEDGNNTLRIMMGAAAPENILEAFEERFKVKLIEIYGMTEIGLPIMTGSERRLGSIGKPRVDYQVKVVDDDDVEVGPNQIGEIVVRPLKPYSIFLEYYKMPDKTVEAWRNLWVHTGDYARYDEDGFFYFVDRKKDAIRRRGENISSFEVEMTVNSHPAVLESAAIAVSSDVGEDEVMVCVTLKPGHSVTPLELTEYCNEKMAYYMVPRYIRFVDSMPKTPTERIKKYQLRQEGITPDTWDREAAGYKLKR